MAYDATDIARYIARKCDREGRPVTHLKLQKLLYFAWLRYYRERGEYLFREDMGAWTFGPVVPSVYFEFSIYFADPIGAFTVEEPSERIDERTACAIDATIDRYAGRSESWLVGETHKDGTPWKKVYGDDGYGKKRKIPFWMLEDEARKGLA
jgi:uncharacterized phage-associated protein